ncbi:hypothetical protein K461DRAFT_75228 [Myriangium duriaei CBS 260.36]|uniref:Uncharacterized protein n=1 Tax=Myriangium duriaei CBS 260.36 TaxID=1168546 RepID=A0A9P4J7J1_9PEZI|nr:hypothetical protein K461DRAFT_75228 [Myriangium duriaei CBS 260.36]
MTDNLLDIEVDADDYATTAANDDPAPTQDRTHVSEEQFQQTKATYRAKIDTGSIYKSLPTALPPPASSPAEPKPSLSGKNVQLIAAAAGELYFNRDYTQLLTVIAWLRDKYNVQGAKLRGRPLGDVLGDWEGRCRRRMEGEERGKAKTEMGGAVGEGQREEGTEKAGE